MNTVKAITRSARISPTKIRPVARSVQGLPAQKALAVLSFAPQKGARILQKTLKSAIANAENNHNLSSADLFVTEAHVDNAHVLKRYMPVARGSAHAITKRYSHIRIVLTDAAPKVKAKKPRNAAKKAEANTKES
jgi:large subunit ribosomal protein L22